MNTTEFLRKAIRLKVFDAEYYSSTYKLYFESEEEAFLDFLRKSVHTNLPGSSFCFDQDQYWHRFKSVLETESPVLDYLLNATTRDLSDIGASSVWRPNPDHIIDIHKYQTIKPIKLAINLHIFYKDAVDAFASALQGFPVDFDLYIGAGTDEIADLASSAFSNLGPSVHVYCQVIPNIGRNFRSMLFEFRDQLLCYDIIMHMHSKKSLYSGHEQALWFSYLLEYLAVDKQTVYKHLALLASSDEAGIIFPTPPKRFTPRWVNHGLKNTAATLRLANLLKRDCSDLKTLTSFSDYPVGSMFIAKTNAIADLLHHDWKDDELPTEPIPNDGTILHAIERFLPRLVEQNEYKSIFYDPSSGTWSTDKSYIWSSYRASRAEMQFIVKNPCLKIISFDVFDTLVSRATGFNDSAKLLAADRILPDLSADQFLKLRNTVEHQIRVSPAFNGDVSIYDVYETLEGQHKLGMGSADCANHEFSLDLDLLVERVTVTESVRAAYKNGISVWYISDIYYSKLQMIALLESFGLPVNPDFLFVSSDLRLRKDSGLMWSHVKDRLEELNVNPLSQYIHVGDNVVSDIQIPGDIGLSSYHVMSPDEYLELGSYLATCKAFDTAKKLRSLSPAGLSSSLQLLTLDTLH